MNDIVFRLKEDFSLEETALRSRKSIIRVSWAPEEKVSIDRYTLYKS